MDFFLFVCRFLHLQCETRTTVVLNILVSLLASFYINTFYLVLNAGDVHVFFSSTYASLENKYELINYLRLRTCVLWPKKIYLFDPAYSCVRTYFYVHSACLFFRYRRKFSICITRQKAINVLNFLNDQSHLSRVLFLFGSLL